jgi:peptidoglycan/LPS O-acetylase OafA/YrhL
LAARPALPALTGLRFVAAAQVVAFHAHAMVPTLRDSPWLTFLGAGYSGVSLFFVLSGFVLTYNYLTPDGAAVTSVREFYAARLARVYAVYGFGMVLAFPIFVRDLQRAGGNAYLLKAGVPITASVVALVQAWIPAYACRLNCPGWSLSTEAFFYLLFPLLGVMLARRKPALLMTIAGVSWVLACGFALLYITRDPDKLGVTGANSYATYLSVLKFNPLIRLPEFVLGVSTGLLFLRKPAALGRYAALASILALGVAITVLALHDRIPYPLMHNGLLAPIYALLIFALAAGVGPLARLLSTRTMKLLGEASFALYLLHVAVLVYVIKGFGVIGLSMETQPVLVVVYLIAVQLLSIAVLRYIEEPARRVIRKWLGGPRRATAG